MPNELFGSTAAELRAYLNRVAPVLRTDPDTAKATQVANGIVNAFGSNFGLAPLAQQLAKHRIVTGRGPKKAPRDVRFTTTAETLLTMAYEAILEIEAYEQRLELRFTQGLSYDDARELVRQELARLNSDPNRNVDHFAITELQWSLGLPYKLAEDAIEFLQQHFAIEDYRGGRVPGHRTWNFRLTTIGRDIIMKGFSASPFAAFESTPQVAVYGDNNTIQAVTGNRNTVHFQQFLHDPRIQDAFKRLDNAIAALTDPLIQQHTREQAETLREELSTAKPRASRVGATLHAIRTFFGGAAGAAAQEAGTQAVDHIADLFSTLGT